MIQETMDLVQELIDSLRDPVNEEHGRMYRFIEGDLRGDDCGFCAQGIMCDLASKRYPDRFEWYINESDPDAVWHFLEKNIDYSCVGSALHSVMKLFGIDNEKAELVVSEFMMNEFNENPDFGRNTFIETGLLDIGMFNDIIDDPWPKLACLMESHMQELEMKNEQSNA